jgi:hypothetical protein
MRRLRDIPWRSLRCAIWLSLSIVALTSCSCASAPPDDAGILMPPHDAGVQHDVGVTFDDLAARCHSLSTAVWDLYARCAPEADRALYTRLFDAMAAAQACTHVGDLRAAIESDVVSFDAGAVDRCIATWASAECGSDVGIDMEVYGADFIYGGDIGILFTRCPGALQGRRPRGEPCTSFYECSGGDVCVGAVTVLDPYACGGTCGPPGAVGDSCLIPLPPCAAGLECGSHYPATQICREPATAGEPCAADQDCWSYAPRGQQMFCGFSSHVCEPFATLGAPCGGPDRVRCDELLVHCIGGTCALASGPDGPCRPALQFGADCEQNVHCVAGSGGMGTCQALAPLGAACATTRDCALDLQCSADGTCSALGAIGDACFVSAPLFGLRAGHELDCAAGLWCAPNSFVSGNHGTCRRQRFAGDSCDASDACIGAACVAGTCVVPAPAGAPCDDQTACATGFCTVDGRCPDPSCMTPQP